MGEVSQKIRLIELMIYKLKLYSVLIMREFMLQGTAANKNYLF